MSGGSVLLARRELTHWPTRLHDIGKSWSDSFTSRETVLAGVLRSHAGPPLLGAPASFFETNWACHDLALRFDGSQTIFDLLRSRSARRSRSVSSSRAKRRNCRVTSVRSRPSRYNVSSAP